MPTKQNSGITIATKSAQISEMEKLWCRIRPLMDGTLACREAAGLLLPRFPIESPEAYSARLNMAVLLPIYSHTMNVMVGKAFSQGIQWGTDTPERIKLWAEDIDLQGHNLHAFAFQVMLEAASYGLCGILSEYPTRPLDEEGQIIPMSVEDAKRLGYRPYFNHIRHDQLLGWKKRRVGGVSGPIVLSQLRFREFVEEDVTSFYTKEVEQIRVIEETRWYTEVLSPKTNKFVRTAEGPNTLGYVPFTPFYGQRRGFMDGVPLNTDLIFLNIKHWQSQSDQDHILHVARVPILAAFGVDTSTFKLEISTSQAIKMPEGSELKFVEHTGSAIGAGQAAIDALELQAIKAGAEIIADPSSPSNEAKSATQVSTDAEGGKSNLKRFVEMSEDQFDLALQSLAEWEPLPGVKPEGGHISLYKEFGSFGLGEASAATILQMIKDGLITRLTGLRELQRRGLVVPELDLQKEVDAAAKEFDEAAEKATKQIVAQHPPPPPPPAAPRLSTPVATGVI